MTTQPTSSPDDRTRPSDDLQRFLWGIPGTILALSAIGAPVGIPMLLRAHAHQRRLEDAPGHARSGLLGTMRETLDHLVGGNRLAGVPNADGRPAWTDGGPGRNS